MNCKKCNGIHFCVSPTIFKNGSEHLERICFDCGAHNGYAPQPITVERAETTEIHFGKHKGMLLGRVMQLEPDYVLWLATKLNGTGPVKKAALKLIEVTK